MRSTTEALGTNLQNLAAFHSDQHDGSAKFSGKLQNTPPVNPFQVEGNWYKASLHTHTTTSDGDANIPERIKQYKALRYNILAITDHEVATDVSGYSDKNMLVLNGAEISARSNSENMCHLVCLNVPVDFKKTEEMSAQDVIDTANNLGGIVNYAHPYTSGHNINDLLAIKDWIGFEVYNGHSAKACRAYDPLHWDELLMCGYAMPAVAVDDSHYSYTIGRGWVMIKAKSLDTESVVESLKKGCYYATCGPTIEDFAIKDGIVTIKSSPVRNIRIISHGFGKNIFAEPGQFITEGQLETRPYMRYVRADVVDEEGRMAWANPIWIKDGD